MKTLLQITALLGLTTAVACGGGGDEFSGDGDGDGQELTGGTVDLCEEACSKADACGSPITDPNVGCSTSCLAAFDNAVLSQCKPQYDDLVECLVLSDSCPTSACTEETRAFNECAPETTPTATPFCTKFCSYQATCVSDSDLNECTSSCESGLPELEQTGCVSPFETFVDCAVDNSACTDAELEQHCIDSAVTLSNCLD